MREGTPSQTAMFTAYLRALHVAVDEPPYVFEDTAAADYLPDVQRRQLKWLACVSERWRGAYHPRPHAVATIGSQVLVRARYAEEALAAASVRGCQRYVILGAGLDTYAQRHAGDPDPLPVVEIDYPATQDWKRARLRETGHTELAAVTYQPVDFEQVSLEDAVGDFSSPQFISWLGTTYYLTRGAVAGTLTRLAERSVSGSELVLDYWRPSQIPGLRVMLAWGTRMLTALQPEPLRSFFDPHDMEALATGAGWRVREHCAPDIQNARYLAERTDGLQVPGFAYLLHLEK